MNRRRLRPEASVLSRLSVVFTIAIAGLACGTDAPSAPSPVTEVVLDPAETSMFTGTTRVFSAVAHNAVGEVVDDAVTWGVSDPAVLSVAGGVVTAKAPGVARVYATVRGVRGEAQISVRLAPVASVTLVAPASTIVVGQTLQLAATTQDAQGQPLTGRLIAFTSRDEAFATVSATGLITGHLTGSATIVASSEGREATFTVVVTNTGTAVGPPARLAFITRPPDREGQVALGDIAVSIHDAHGNLVTDATTSVTVALAPNPIDENVHGVRTVNAQGGVATFRDLAVANPGRGFVLQASAPGLAAATSTSFDVRLTFKRISVGASHACAITVIGAAYCWGENHNGQLGDGTDVSRPAPTAVLGGLRFVEVSAGRRLTCGVTTGSDVYCWGSNGALQAGGTDVANQLVPNLVPGGLAFVQVSAGAIHSCGLTKENIAYCWGSGTTGALGDGTVEPARGTPGPVAGDLRFAEVHAGTVHSCGVTTAGRAYCWGDNEWGRLGDGTTTNRPLPTAVVGDPVFADLSADQNQTCGVTVGRVTYCWSSFGGVGHGSGAKAPTLVDGGIPLVQVGTGYHHSCGVDSTGVAYCWGSGGNGRLGYEPLGYTGIPVAVAGGLQFVEVGAGDAHSCGVTTDGSAYCWGMNSAGELGIGPTSPRVHSTPTPLRVAH